LQPAWCAWQARGIKAQQPGSEPGWDWDFMLLRTISNFIYEMVESLGGNCHGWQFQEKGAWMPLFSDPVGSITFLHFISKI